MKVGIFYFSANRGKDRQPIYHPLSGDLPTVIGYLRCEVVESEGEAEALDAAHPQPGESLMNTHELK